MEYILHFWVTCSQKNDEYATWFNHIPVNKIEKPKQFVSSATNNPNHVSRIR
jgi:hypothetical protein